MSPSWMVVELFRRSSQLVSRRMTRGAMMRKRMAWSHTLARMIRR